MSPNEQMLLEKGLMAIRKATDKTVELVGGFEKFDHLKGHDLTHLLTEEANIAPGQLAFNTSNLSIRTTIRLKGHASSIEVEYSLMDGSYPDPEIQVRWEGGGVMTPAKAVILAEEHRKTALLGCQLEVIFMEMAKTLTGIDSSSRTPVDGRRKSMGVTIGEILGKFHDETEKKLKWAAGQPRER